MVPSHNTLLYVWYQTFGIGPPHPVSPALKEIACSTGDRHTIGYRRQHTAYRLLTHRVSPAPPGIVRPTGYRPPTHRRSSAAAEIDPIAQRRWFQSAGSGGHRPQPPGSVSHPTPSRRRRSSAQIDPPEIIPLSRVRPYRSYATYPRQLTVFPLCRLFVVSCGRLDVELDAERLNKCLSLSLSRFYSVYPATSIMQYRRCYLSSVASPFRLCRIYVRRLSVVPFASFSRPSGVFSQSFRFLSSSGCHPHTFCTQLSALNFLRSAKFCRLRGTSAPLRSLPSPRPSQAAPTVNRRPARRPLQSTTDGTKGGRFPISLSHSACFFSLLPGVAKTRSHRDRPRPDESGRLPLCRPNTADGRSTVSRGQRARAPGRPPLRRRSAAAVVAAGIFRARKTPPRAPP